MVARCEAFSWSSHYIHNWLTVQPNVKEESLTDWLLYNLSQLCADVLYKSFTRHEEGRTTGADWEWWLVFRDGAMRLRVQAKKLRAADNYAGLAHSNQHGMQIVKLIDDATRVNAYPIYALYSVRSSPQCPLPRHFQEGVHLAAATAIDQLIMSRSIVSEAAVLAAAVPLSCLPCCPLVEPSAGIDGLTGFVRRYFIKHQEPSTHGSVAGQYAAPPPFVEALLTESGVTPDWWEAEFSRELDGLEALLVTDLRSPSASQDSRDS